MIGLGKNTGITLPLIGLCFSHLPDPDFVSSTAEGDFVFFFFRELAVEYSNCGKVSSKSWTSFTVSVINEQLI